MDESGPDQTSADQNGSVPPHPYAARQESATEVNRFNRALGLPEQKRTIAPAGRPAQATATSPVINPTAPQARRASSNIGGHSAPPVAPSPNGIDTAAPNGVLNGAVPLTTSPTSANGSALDEVQPLAENESWLRSAFNRYKSQSLRVKRSRRTIRHVDPWSVFKVSVILYVCLYVAVLLAGVFLWSALQRTGLVDRLEDFIQEVGSYAVWEIDGGVLFARARIIGLVLAAAGVAFNVVMAIIFNLVSDLVGGVRVTILEDDTTSPDR